MRFLSFLALAALLSLTACQDDDPSGVQTTPLGSRYTLFRTGSGPTPEAGDFVYFHAIMRTEGDSVLFNTRLGGGPAPVIQAAADSIQEVGDVEDVLRYMSVGDSAIVRVSLSEFGPQKPPGMENDSVILYAIETTEILSQEEFNDRQAEEERVAEEARNVVRAREPEMIAFANDVYQQYKAGSLENIRELPSGLRYVIHEEGTGKEADPGMGVVVQYIGMLSSDGTVFDQSFERGEGIPFPLGGGRVIRGWDEGIAELREGDRATLIIPSDLAYGEQGTPGGDIPPGSELLFYVELEEVQ